MHAENQGLRGRMVQFGVTLALVFAFSAITASAQEKAKKELPFIVISAASVERVLREADLAFESAGRAELSESLGGLLGRANDLKGLDRDAPTGLMLFPGSAILPEAVLFVPVKDLDDLLKTVSFPRVTPRKLESGRIEISVPGQTLFADVKNGFAFVANNEASLERDFPSPADVVGRLTVDYDLALSVNFSALSKTTREFYLGFLRGQADADLQRRNNEPEGAYKVRRAVAKSNMELVEQIFTQAEELTLGWGVNPKDKRGAFEFVVRGVPGTDLAKALNEMDAGRTHFAGLLTGKAPISASLALKLSKRNQKMLKAVFSGVRQQMGLDLSRRAAGADAAADTPENADVGSMLAPLFDTLNGTVDAGVLDGALQVTGDGVGTYAVAGGLRVAGADRLATFLNDILDFAKKNDPNAETVTKDAASYRNMSIHRFVGRRAPAADERRYGGKPNIYLASGEGVLWFAIGGDPALPAMKQVMDTVAKPVESPVPAIPFQMLINFSSALEFMAAPRPDRANDFFDRAKANFAQGNDVLRIETRTSDNVLRFRVQLDAGFTRLVGTTIGSYFDAGRP